MKIPDRINFINLPSERIAPLQRSIPLVIIALLTLAVVAGGAHRLISLEAVLAFRERFQSIVGGHRGLAIVVFIATYAGVVSLMLPGSIFFSLVAGAVFGWFEGGLIAMTAATIGASVVFAIARSTIGVRLARRAGPQVARLQAGFCENALSYLLFLRLVPVFPFFVVNVVPALLGVRFGTYLLGTVLGIVPASFAYSSAGAGLDKAMLAAKAVQAQCLTVAVAADCPLSLQLAALLTPEMRIALTLLGVLALLPVAYNYWRRRNGC